MWGRLVQACAAFGMADAPQKEPDVADLPPEAAQWVFELRVRAVRESDGRPVPHTALRVDGGNEAFGRWQKTITTGADGRAAVRLPTGRYRVYPLADPFAFAWSQSFELEAEHGGHYSAEAGLRARGSGGRRLGQAAGRQRR